MFTARIAATDSCRVCHSSSFAITDRIDDLITVQLSNVTALVEYAIQRKSHFFRQQQPKSVMSINRKKNQSHQRGKSHRTPERSASE